MACVFPRLDPALAYPVPLRPSVFQHARFIDKMQPSVARVKQEKFEVGYQEEPLNEGMWIIRQFSTTCIARMFSLGESFKYQNAILERDY